MGLDRGHGCPACKIVNAHFSYPPQPEGNIRNIAAWGGGPIWDIGCYCLLSGMMLLAGTPELVAVHKEREEHLDVEKTATAIVDFGNGQTLHFTASGSSLQQSVTLVGTKGWAKLDVPFNAPHEQLAAGLIMTRHRRPCSAPVPRSRSEHVTSIS